MTPVQETELLEAIKSIDVSLGRIAYALEEISEIEDSRLEVEQDMHELADSNVRYVK